jgi:hypothetical protein
MESSKIKMKLMTLLRNWALGTEAPGDIRYVDVNEDGKIDFDDRTDIEILFLRQLWV